MSIKVAEVTIGCDPELAVYDRMSKKTSLIPAWSVCPAKKGEPPHPLKDGVSIHADGVGLEFNMSPVPLDQFSNSTRKAMQLVQKYVRDVSMSQACNWDIYITPESKTDPDAGLSFSKETLAHPLANSDGCDPDFCAYNEKPTQPRTRTPLVAFPTQRFFGGHIHLGYDTQVVPAWALTRFLDMFVYVPVIPYDLQPARRTIFGQAGIYRPKTYGVEYRTPSPFWLSHDAVLANMVGNIRAVFHGFETNPDAMNEFHNDFNWKLVQNYIDTYDKKYLQDQRPDSKEFDNNVILRWANTLKLKGFKFIR